MSLILFFISGKILGQNQTFTSSGTFTVPAGITTITVECWGGGGAGGGNTSNSVFGGGGGAGGAYAKKSISVIPGNSYTVTVGGIRTGGNAAGGNGNPSWFGTAATVYAEGGAGGAAPNGGTASGGVGSAAASIGDIVYAGGNGANGTSSLSGGGGGGAGSQGPGGNATGITSGTGTSLNGGNGGIGRTNEGNGNAGASYGGGGSGAFIPNNKNHRGGNGAAGLVVITWSGAYTANGTFKVPAGVTSIIVECWGAGGAGGGTSDNTRYGGGGGAGGAYARRTLSVIPGDTYTVTVGGTTNGLNSAGATGNPSWFGTAGTVYAQGGAGGAAPNGGTAQGGIGSAASSIGDVVYAGGNGASGTVSRSGGGGGGAGTTGAGGNATGTTPGTGTAADGGNGGSGLTVEGNGNTGSVFGGGGSGGFVPDNTNHSGGNGANGQVVITWTQPVFYSQGSGDPALLSNWATSEGYPPLSFTDNRQTFVIIGGHTMTTSGTAWIISGFNTFLEIQNGGILNETTAITLSPNTSLQIDGGGTLNHFINSESVFNGSETFHDNSTVNYGFAGVQTVIDAAYGNLTLSGSGLKTINVSLINGILSMEGTAAISATPDYGADAGLQYKGSSAQVTGPELPGTFTGTSGIIIDNTSGVSLSGSVIANDPVILTSGTLSVGANTLTLQNSDTPIIRTSGTMTTTSDSNLSFGSPGNTAGNNFTIPSGTFSSDPVINNLTVYRTENLTLNDQMISIKGFLLNNGPINTNGNLTLLSTADGTAFIDGSGTGQISGNVTMQRYLPSGFGYKYFSSPFQASTVNEFADDMNLSSSFPAFYRYDEARTTSGWVSYTDPAGVLVPLHGYTVNFGNTVTPRTVDVTGIVNNGMISRTIFNNNNTYTKGYNLAGNPYPSPIDWDAIAGWNKINIDNALYYFQAGGADEYSGTYSTYINGISSDGVLNKNIIPSMQGFFVHVSNGTFPVSGTLEMDNRVRITDQTHQFIKSGSREDSRFLIRISAKMSDAQRSSADHMVIYFDDKALEEFDSRLDALKLMNTDPLSPNFYSLGSDGIKLSINALPNSDDTLLTVPLGLRSVINGNITFEVKDILNLPPGIQIYLSDAITAEDKLLYPNSVITIKLAPGEINNRFSLKFVKGITDIPKNNPGSGIFTVFNSYGTLVVNIDYLPGKRGILLINNLSGQVVLKKDIYSLGYYEFNAQMKPGIYFVNFISGYIRETKKILILN